MHSEATTRFIRGIFGLFARAGGPQAHGGAKLWRIGRYCGRARPTRGIGRLRGTVTRRRSAAALRRRAASSAARAWFPSRRTRSRTGTPPSRTIDHRGQIVPRLDQRIAQHGALHQPEAERQHEPAAEPGRQLAVHDHEPAARPQLLPGVVQHRQMMRHGVVGQAEHHAVERLGRDVFGGVLLDQLDIRPLFALAQLLRLRSMPVERSTP